MMNLDTMKMQAVVTTALASVTSNKRWANAIRRAAVEIEANPMMHYDGQALLILSKSNEIYEANGICQCAAFRKGFPCWHRAAARLVRRYRETS